MELSTSLNNVRNELISKKDSYFQEPYLGIYIPPQFRDRLCRHTFQINLDSVQEVAGLIVKLNPFAKGGFKVVSYAEEIYWVNNTGITNQIQKLPNYVYIFPLENKVHHVRSEALFYQKLGKVDGMNFNHLTFETNIVGIENFTMPVMIQDRCECNLVQYLNKTQLDDVQSLKIIETVKAAIEYLNEKRFTNYDIKPTNVLVKNGNPLLSDFDSVKSENEEANITSPDFCHVLYTMRMLKQGFKKMNTQESMDMVDWIEGYFSDEDKMDFNTWGFQSIAQAIIRNVYSSTNKQWTSELPWSDQSVKMWKLKETGPANVNIKVLKSDIAAISFELASFDIYIPTGLKENPKLNEYRVKAVLYFRSISKEEIEVTELGKVTQGKKMKLVLCQNSFFNKFSL